MSSRIELQEKLESLSESENVYFQPPSSVKMQYPAIRYSLKRVVNNHANNSIYKQMTAYEVIVLDYNPESPIADKVSKLPYCTLDRFYVANNLNHFVYTLYH